MYAGRIWRQPNAWPGKLCPQVSKLELPFESRSHIVGKSGQLQRQQPSHGVHHRDRPWTFNCESCGHNAQVHQMNINRIIFSQPISAVWKALGGDPPRRGRASAFYRKGDNPGVLDCFGI